MHGEAERRQACTDLPRRVEVRQLLRHGLGQPRRRLAGGRREGDARLRREAGVRHQQAGERGGLAGARAAREHGEPAREGAGDRTLLCIVRVEPAEDVRQRALAGRRGGQRRGRVQLAHGACDGAFGLPQPVQVERTPIQHQRARRRTGSDHGRVGERRPRGGVVDGDAGIAGVGRAPGPRGPGRQQRGGGGIAAQAQVAGGKHPGERLRHAFAGHAFAGLARSAHDEAAPRGAPSRRSSVRIRRAPGRRACTPTPAGAGEAMPAPRRKT